MTPGFKKVAVGCLIFLHFDTAVILMGRSGSGGEKVGGLIPAPPSCVFGHFTHLASSVRNAGV